MFYEDYDKENWKSLVNEERFSEKDFARVDGSNVFGAQSEQLLEELNHLLHLICKGFIGRQVRIIGRIRYDCRDQQQAFFIESIHFD